MRSGTSILQGVRYCCRGQRLIVTVKETPNTTTTTGYDTTSFGKVESTVLIPPYVIASTVEYSSRAL